MKLFLGYVGYVIVLAIVAMGFGLVWHSFSVEFHKSRKSGAGIQPAACFSGLPRKSRLEVGYRVNPAPLRGNKFSYEEL